MKLLDEHPHAHTLELIDTPAWKPMAKAYKFLPEWNATPIKKELLPDGARLRPKTRLYKGEEDAYVHA